MTNDPVDNYELSTAIMSEPLTRTHERDLPSGHCL